ncbi:MAG: hypothetical protein AAGC66_00070 [Leifsonia sp.]
MTLDVDPNTQQISLLLDESGGAKSLTFKGDVPEVSSGSDIHSDKCWRAVEVDGWHDLKRSDAAKCTNSNSVVLAWWSQSSGTSGPYAWSYVPAMQLSVDRRPGDGKGQDQLAGPNVPLTSEYNLDIDPTILAYGLHTSPNFSLRSARLFARSSDQCVGVADSDVVSTWNCTPSFTARDASTPAKGDVILPAAYSVYQQDGYESEREVMLLLLGALLGFIGGGIYAELQYLTSRRSSKVATGCWSQKR